MLGPPKSAHAQPPSVLASSFAPVLHFVSGEKFYPVSIDYLIGSSSLRQRFSNGTSALADPSPSPSTLGTYNSPDYFLDNKLGTLDAISTDYTSKLGSIGYRSYVSVTNSSSFAVVRYWLFYAFNNGPLNDHQGDLEVIEIFLDASGNPQEALYSQHGAGENAGWSDVEKIGTHPVVYVAKGSHANYFRPYQGRIGIENDIVGNNGVTVRPTDLNTVLLGDRGVHPPDQSWLDFPGRWGHVGTDQEVALGEAGPLGPVFNQGGIRWGQPGSYLQSTFRVNQGHFILAFLSAYFLLIMSAYLVIRAAWKVLGIVRLHRKGGLLIGQFVRSRGVIGLLLAVVAIVLTVAGLFLPWYRISASSQVGPFAQQGGVTLLHIDGTNGIQVNTFLSSAADSPSGYATLFFLQIPFATLLAAGVALLVLDVIGVRSGKKLGGKMMTGALTSLLPFVLIFVFITQLPSFLPFAASLIPGQTILPELETILRTVADKPISGSTSEQFPFIGTTTVNWGYGLGAYLFLAAAAIRIIGGILVRRTPELRKPEILPNSNVTQTAAK